MNPSESSASITHEEVGQLAAFLVERGHTDVAREVVGLSLMRAVYDTAMDMLAEGHN